MFEKIAAKFGSLAKFMHRKGDAKTSVNAAHKVNSRTLEQRVYDTIRSYGPKGCISDEVIRKHADHTPGSITPRYAGLRRKALIVCSGETRIGDSGLPQQVMIATEFAPNVAKSPLFDD